MLPGNSNKVTEAGGGIGLGGGGFSQLGSGTLLGASDVTSSKSAFGDAVRGASSLFGGGEGQLGQDVGSALGAPGAELGEARTTASALSLTGALGVGSSWAARTDALDTGLSTSLDSMKAIGGPMTTAASDNNPQVSATGPDPLGPSVTASEAGRSNGLGGGSTSAGDAVTSSALGGSGSSVRQQLGGGAPPEIIEKALQEFPPSFSKETEDEANSYFQRLYNMQSNGSAPGTQVLSVDDMLDLLRQFKNSNSQKQVIDRILHILVLLLYCRAT